MRMLVLIRRYKKAPEEAVSVSNCDLSCLPYVVTALEITRDCGKEGKHKQDQRLF